MDYKDILVFLDAGDNTQKRLELAVSLCQRFEANLLGVDVSPPETFEGEYADRAVNLEAAFRDSLGESRVQGTYRVADWKTASWKDFFTHYADLVIATQRGEDAAAISPKGIPDDVVASAGVPVLVLPSTWDQSTLGDSVVVAWNSSRESTRAMHDALPFLRAASRVTIFEFAPPSDHIESAPELVRTHLGHHGVDAEIFAWPDTRRVDPMDALFACLDRQQADLIVAGAFGHSRLVEEILGSASGELLHNPSMPVLMSH